MKISDYLKETKAEMKHVNWPTRQQSIAFTIVVVAISLAFSAYLGLFDYLSSLAIRMFIN